ncbi:Uncharacterised protein [uncultured archaeon]|nr:Uncharacterised protein [uncultured archaeon]
MAKIKGNKIALVVGIYVAGLHAFWALLTAIGVTQNYLDWILPLHFINNLFVVTAFNWASALILVAVAFVGGYAATWLFVWLWNAIKVK